MEFASEAEVLQSERESLSREFSYMITSEIPLVFEEIIENLRKGMFLLSDLTTKFPLAGLRTNNDEPGSSSGGASGSGAVAATASSAANNPRKKYAIEGTLVVEGFLVMCTDMIVRPQRQMALGISKVKESQHALMEPCILTQLQNAYNYMHMAFRALSFWKNRLHEMSLEELVGTISFVLSAVQKASKEILVSPENAFPHSPHRYPPFAPALPSSLVLDFNIVDADLVVSMYTFVAEEDILKPKDALRKDKVLDSPGSPTIQDRKAAKLLTGIISVGTTVTNAAATFGKGVVAGVGQVGGAAVGLVTRAKTKRNTNLATESEINLKGFQFQFEGKKCEIVSHIQVRHPLPMVKSALVSLEKAINLCTSIHTKTMIHPWLL